MQVFVKDFCGSTCDGWRMFNMFIQLTQTQIEDFYTLPKAIFKVKK